MKYPGYRYIDLFANLSIGWHSEHPILDLTHDTNKLSHYDRLIQGMMFHMNEYHIIFTNPSAQAGYDTRSIF